MGEGDGEIERKERPAKEEMKGTRSSRKRKEIFLVAIIIITLFFFLMPDQDFRHATNVNSLVAVGER